MAALTVRLPASVHQKVRELAARDGVSVNQFVAGAVAEKMSAVLTLDYLRAEAARARRGDFDALLAMVPDAPAADGDEPADRH
ncbi:MAG: type II toxin-antitoxin system HicB family antitoxin [Actinomycetia bacterium]|nr:type II toxin-antitoxin system HicB family antitoxin [Actinomycetes bacterium]